MKITTRMWILIVFVILSAISIFSLPPQAFEKGVLVSSVNPDSLVFQDGLRKGMILRQVNGNEISNVQDYYDALEEVSNLKENETIKGVWKFFFNKMRLFYDC